MNDAVEAYAKGRFTLRTTPPHTPEVNGIAERCNRLIVERATALLKDAFLKLNVVIVY